MTSDYFEIQDTAGELFATAEAFGVAAAVAQDLAVDHGCGFVVVDEEGVVLAHITASCSSIVA